MRRLRNWFAAVSVAALAIGTLAIAAPAGAGENGWEGWPTLRVEKTIGEANDNGDEVDFPEGTEFTVKVTCEAPEKSIGAATNGSYYPTFVTFLTFDEDGNPESADPSDGWFKDGDAWVLHGEQLKYKLCVAEETDIESDDNGNGNGAVNEDDVEVAYKCEARASSLYNNHEEAVTDGYYDLYFGCVRPQPEGEYDDDAEDAAVQFTKPWRNPACENGNSEPVSPSQNGTKCQETGTLTVDNTWDPPDPEVVTPAPAPVLAVSPTFTG